jgi:RNA polymerase sigma-70 factor, ECF subfamily
VDDRALVQEVLAGNGEAFNALVVRQTDDVFRTCYRILGTVDEAQDAAQETFLSAYRSLATFRADGSLGAWLGAIAVRQSLKRLGARRRIATLDAPIGDADTMAGADEPLGDVLSAERRDTVRRAVAALDEPYREVVAMRFFADMSLERIAAGTGRPLGTVKAQLHRGLERLRRSMTTVAR